VTSLSPGKRRGLQVCSTASGGMAILALDHRNALRKLLPPSPDPSAALVRFKMEVVSFLSTSASAVLLDPEFGAAQAILSDTLPGNVGLIVAMEATGYTGNPVERNSRLLRGWSVAKAKRLGANVVKLLVYYHPESPTASAVERLVQEVADECMLQDIALLLEPLSYSLEAEKANLTGSERRRVVIETARRLTPLGVDALKAEFPAETTQSPGQWESACRELSEASSVPWVLLSASVDFATYAHQVEVACRAGASGVAAGRAVWQEAVTLSGEHRLEFLATTGRERMALLSQLSDISPWTQFYGPTQAVEYNWYECY